jgi:hypothetical protein
MNKVIIVGHPSSGLQDVESLLSLAGMKAAQPSKRKKLQPNEITNILCKAHSVDSQIGSRKFKYQQLRPLPLWNELAVDLEIGNSEQLLWGWADSQIISLLTYWRSIDSEILFVLIYDEAHRMLLDFAIKPEIEMTETNINILLEEWISYNEAMLSFFTQNSDDCILINSSQALLEPLACLKQLDKKIVSPHSQNFVNFYSANYLNSNAKTDYNNLLRAATEPSCYLLVKSNKKNQVGSLERLIVDEYLKEKPRVSQVFVELQSNANLPLQEVLTKLSDTLKPVNDLASQHKFLASILSQIHATKSDHDLMVLKFNQLQEEIEHYHLENRQLKVKAKNPQPPLIGAVKVFKNQLDYRLGSILVNNSTNLIGLILMPYSLMHEFLIFRKQKAQERRLHQNTITTYSDAHEVELIKKQLSYRLGHIIINNVSSPVGWIKLPFVLIHEIQSFHKNKKNKKASAKNIIKL